MIRIHPHAEGAIVGIRAQPGAKRVGVLGVHNGLVKIAVAAPPDKGKANDALAVELARVLGVKRSDVAIVSGQTSREKRFLVRGLSVEDLAEKLRDLVGEG